VRNDAEIPRDIKLAPFGNGVKSQGNGFVGTKNACDLRMRIEKLFDQGLIRQEGGHDDLGDRDCRVGHGRLSEALGAFAACADVPGAADMAKHSVSEAGEVFGGEFTTFKIVAAYEMAVGVREAAHDDNERDFARVDFVEIFIGNCVVAWKENDPLYAPIEEMVNHLQFVDGRRWAVQGDGNIAVMSEFLLESSVELGPPFRMDWKDGANDTGAASLDAGDQTIGAVA